MKKSVLSFETNKHNIGLPTFRLPANTKIV